MQNIFVGRQAIYDRDLRLYAYELLYRKSLDNRAHLSDGDLASSRLILNAFMEIGLEKIAGDHRVFLNLTRRLLLEQPPIPFDKERVVLEILEDIELDTELIHSLKSLAGEGYVLALDDFEFEPKWEPVLPHARIVKVEVPTLDWDNLEARVHKLKQHQVLLLAEKVETKSEFTKLRELEFDLFQGYYFSRPQIISGKRLNGNQLFILKLLANLNDTAITPVQLEALIRQDPGLVLNILRYLNSAAIALPRKVESIKQAIVYMGLNRLKAWASLLILSRIDDKPEEMFTTALVRAHMCAGLIGKIDNSLVDQALTTGLLSIMDSLMDCTLAEIIAQIPLADTIREALLERRGILGKALSCALAFENCDWDQAAFQDLTANTIQELYNHATSLAFQERDNLLH
ncbi:MAG: HDOD domain-containing protein [Gammaproteobacteria bacterium]|nr:HDOD domain-containing protein [Gammaproteobacteria bacterium]